MQGDATDSIEIYQEERITGVMVQYYVSCKRELWLFANHISFNKYDENIRIGKQIHTNRYKRKKREIDLYFVKFDFIEKKDEIILSEVKKSSKLLEPVKYQLLYYMYIIEKLTGKTPLGKIRIPREKKVIELELKQQERKEIEEILDTIPKIVQKEIPDGPTKKPYCKNCAYHNYCWI